MKSFDEILQEIVESIDVSDIVYNSSNLSEVNYQFGYPREIVNIITNMTRNRTDEAKKFPLIAGLTGYSRSGRRDEIIDNLVVIIVSDTAENSTTKERITNNFNPILYPLCEKLFDEFDYSHLVSWNRKDQKTTDYPYYGREGLYGSEANIFNDIVDAIVVEFKDIELINKC